MIEYDMRSFKTYVTFFDPSLSLVVIIGLTLSNYVTRGLTPSPRKDERLLKAKERSERGEGADMDMVPRDNPEIYGENLKNIGGICIYIFF